MKFMTSFVVAFPFEEESVFSVKAETKSLLNKKSHSKNSRHKLKSDAKQQSKSTFDSNKFVEGVGYFMKPLSYLARSCLIEYTLPSKDIVTKSIQIDYFGNCALIITNKTETMIKTNIIGDKSIVAFTIIHQIDSSEVTTPFIINGQKLRADFKILYDKPVNDKIYFHFTNVNNANCGILQESEDFKIPDDVNNIIKLGQCSCLFRKLTPFHLNDVNKMVNIINDINLNELMEGRQITQVEKNASSKILPRSAKSNKSNKSNKLRNLKTELSLEIDAVKLLFEKPIWNEGKMNENPKNLIYGGLVVTCTDVFTDEQRRYFKILGINIRSIENLPSCALSSLNIDSISINYSLPPIIQEQSIPSVKLDYTEKIKFKDYKIFFNHLVLDDKLIETIQSDKLIIKVIGKRDKIKEQIDGRVWGQELTCTDFSKRFSDYIDEVKTNMEMNQRLRDSNESEQNFRSKKNIKKKGKSKKNVVLNIERKSIEVSDNLTEEVILGFAVLELSDLLKYSYRIVSFTPIVNSLINERRETIRPMNLMHFHKDNRIVEYGLLSDMDLKENKSCIKLELMINFNLNRFVLSEVLTQGNIYTRCIIIDYNINSAYNLLNEILKHNQESMEHAHQFPNVCYQNIAYSGEIAPNNDNSRFYNDYSKPVNQDYFSGFMIECNDCCILMTESLEIHHISKIMVHRYNMGTEDGRMLYNSNLVFTERMYDDFTKFGGIFVCAIGLPLNSVLNYKKAAKSVPAPALRCVQILKNILNAKSIKRCLFPTPLELLSMNVEFGLPIHKNSEFQK